MSIRILVTGANGAIGRRILLRGVSEPLEWVAGVRSERAARELPPLPADRVRVARIAYERPETLEAAFEGVSRLIHLPGVLIERPGSSYQQANVETTRQTLAVARRCKIQKLVLVSAVGADPTSSNRFFRSKGEAEEIVRGSGIRYTILRAPLVLGPGTEGTRAALRQSRSRAPWLLGGGRNLQQPLDVEDLALATLLSAQNLELACERTLDLVGPECLPHREIVERMARLRGQGIRVRSVPLRPLRWLLAARTRLLGPGLSSDAIDVIVAHTRLDSATAATALGISLTPLDDTLRASLAPTEPT